MTGSMKRKDVKRFFTQFGDFMPKYVNQTSGYGH